MYRIERNKRAAGANARDMRRGGVWANSVEVFQKKAKGIPITIGRSRTVGVRGITPKSAEAPSRFACGSILRRKCRAEIRLGERKKTNVTFTKAQVIAQLSQGATRFFFRLQTGMIARASPWRRPHTP